MTKLKYCLYSWRQYIAFRMYVGFRFDKIWCISTKLRICIRNVCILERIQNLIFGDSESFSSKGIYGPHTWQHKKYLLCPSMIYCLYDVYWVHIWPDMVHINKTQDMYRKCPYSRKNQNSIFEDSWSFRPVWRPWTWGHVIVTWRCMLAQLRVYLCFHWSNDPSSIPPIVDNTEGHLFT